MKSKLRFSVSALVWAILLLVAYTVPAQMQTDASGNHQPARIDSTVTQATAAVTATGPISLGDVGNPFQATLGELPPSNQFKVPSGKRLVIEYVSGRIPVGFGQQLQTLLLLTTVNNAESPHFFTPTFTGAGSQSIFTVSQQTRIYADPETLVTVGTGGANVSAMLLTISGYLVNVQ